MCRALPSLHAFTGCDSVSAFAGKGKVSSLKLLIGNTNMQETFKDLGTSWTLPEDMFRKLESFTYKLYSSKSNEEDVNELCYKMFCTKKGEVESYLLPHVQIVSECTQSGLVIKLLYGIIASRQCQIVHHQLGMVG